MTDKLTSVSVDHESGEVVAVTINADSGKIASIEKAEIPEGAKDTQMKGNGKAIYE